MWVRPVFVLLVFLLLASSVPAKRVEDREHVFSLEVPDRWRYNPPDWTGAGACYHNADESASISFRCYDTGGLNLDAWARFVAHRTPEIEILKIYKDSLNDVPCRRLESPTSRSGTSGDVAVQWLTTRRGRGVGIILVYPKESEKSIQNVRKRLTGSFRWVQ